MQNSNAFFPLPHSQASARCEDMIPVCWYGGLQYNCSKLFMPTITESGLCCSFNMISQKFIYKNTYEENRIVRATYYFMLYIIIFCIITISRIEQICICSVHIMPVDDGLEQFFNARAIDWDPEIGFSGAAEQLKDPYSFPRPVTGQFICFLNFVLIFDILLDIYDIFIG